jgi:hypothetical protein
MFKKVLITILLLILSISAYSAESLDSKGKDFWLAFPKNYGSELVALYIAGEKAASGTVSISSEDFSEDFTVAPGEVTTVTLPLSVVVTTNDTIENKGIHITANEEISIYGINRMQATTDAYQGLPVDVLGTEYLSLSYSTSIGGYGSDMTVLAAEDNTSITITPSVTTGTRTADTPFTITLNQGEVFRLEAANAPDDMTGTSITSDKPVALFSGVVCANIPSSAGACDHIVEQIPPSDTWGKNFVSVPLATRLKGDTFRFLASEDATSISINGTQVATINKGEYHEQIVTESSQIVSDKPILVAQYSNGTSFDNVTSDPFMMLIPPYEQFQASYTITTPATGFDINYVNLVVPEALKGSITFDDGTVPEESFTQISEITLGSHSFSALKPFGVFTYGFANADSYGYPGGSSFAPVASYDHYTLDSSSQVNVKIGEDACSTVTAYDSENNTLEGMRFIFDVTGANTASGIVNTGADGSADFCYTVEYYGEDTISMVDPSGTQDTKEVTVADTTPTYSITIAVGANGSLLNPESAFSVEQGTAVALQIKPSESYAIDTITFNDADILSDGTLEEGEEYYTFTYNPESDGDFLVSFKYVPSIPSTPVTTAPAENSVLASAHVVFSWDAVIGAEKYIIEIDGPVEIEGRVLTTENLTISQDGTTVSWKCPVALSDGTYTWRVAASNTEGTSDYQGTDSSFSISRPGQIKDLGDGDEDIDFEDTEEVTLSILDSIKALNDDYPVHTETGLNLKKNQDGEEVTVTTIAQINLGSVINNADLSELIVNTKGAKLTFENADAFPAVKTSTGETIPADQIGLIVQAHEANTAKAEFDVTMLVTAGANAGKVVHELESPVSFVLEELEMQYQSGVTEISLNGEALIEVAEGGSDDNPHGYWYFSESDGKYHVTVKHFSEVTVQNSETSSGNGGMGCAVTNRASSADVSLIFFAMIAVYMAVRRLRKI